ncbi:MAG: hypothetical protein HKN70_02210, partial [Gammaproteobacteria bacterium]|nr:hypothetical protein [Gammaproteobacteria bacterium]
LTMIVRPRIEDPLDDSLRIPMGPGLVVAVEEGDLTPTGKIKDESTITNLEPVGGGPRLTMDEGNGDYRFVVVNVNVINDEVEIDVYVNNNTPKKVKSPKVDTIPGC